MYKKTKVCVDNSMYISPDSSPENNLNPFTNRNLNPFTDQNLNPYSSYTKNKKLNNTFTNMEISSSNMESSSCEMDISPTDIHTRYISKHVIQAVLRKQNYKCANSIKDYTCLLWKINNGNFDEAGYHFDHINEYCLTKDNSLDNIQALCPNCHSVKTKRFRKNKNVFTTHEIDNGCGIMEL
jgi:5-methylcytosine-specific restriction endonuclease McrA